jgi:plasmid maintenance system killer protein
MAARRAYALFAQNPDHPSLRFKKLGGYDRVWSVRVNEQYRAIGERHGDTIVGLGSAHTTSLTISLVEG